MIPPTPGHFAGGSNRYLSNVRGGLQDSNRASKCSGIYLGESSKNASPE